MTGLLTFASTEPATVREGLERFTQPVPDDEHVAGRHPSRWKARSLGLALPALPLTPPVRLQLQSRTGACWEAVYSSPKHTDPARFMAKSD